MHPLRFGSNGHLGHGQVLLVGDAAGQVKVSTVGGVVTGMRGGSAAVRALTGRASYAFELKSLRQELNFHAVVRRILDNFTDEDYAQLLRLLNHRALEVLSMYNRDELAYAIWRLLPAQPRWMLLGARALLRGYVPSPIHHRGSESRHS
jgi:flavin-dependent dehydrogenase